MLRNNVIKSLFLFAVVTMFVSCDKETVITGNDLPSEAMAYIQTHFPSNTVMQVVKDQDGLTKTYDVILEGGIELEFNRKEEIISIESITKLPDSVIPEKILTYVTTNYSDNFIIGWELDGKKQQVELDNELDLEFDKNDDFLRIDG